MTIWIFYYCFTSVGDTEGIYIGDVIDQFRDGKRCVNQVRKEWERYGKMEGRTCWNQGIKIEGQKDHGWSQPRSPKCEEGRRRLTRRISKIGEIECK